MKIEPTSEESKMMDDWITEDPIPIVRGDAPSHHRAQPVKLTKFQKVKLAEQLMAEINAHDTHKRKQVGSCVYCVDCDKRLYQGTL